MPSVGLAALLVFASGCGQDGATDPDVDAPGAATEEPPTDPAELPDPAEVPDDPNADPDDGGPDATAPGDRPPDATEPDGAGDEPDEGGDGPLAFTARVLGGDTVELATIRGPIALWMWAPW